MRIVIVEYEHNVFFVDMQKRGPYARWRHEHRFVSISANATLMLDRIDYEVGRGVIGAIADILFVRRQLRRILDYRAARIRRALPGDVARFGN